MKIAVHEGIRGGWMRDRRVRSVRNLTSKGLITGGQRGGGWVEAHDRLSDELLLQGFCAGNEQCAEKFVRHFSRRLYWIALRIVGDSGSAEDVVQIAFERAWRKGSTFDPERGSLDMWIATVARNIALDWVRMRGIVPIDPSEISMSPTLPSSDPEGKCGLEETQREIRSALTGLSPNLARSVVMAGAFDMTAAEVARYENIPLGTAKTRVRAAKHRLRKELISLR
jgi:RNA polymerase sigma factor (sigma-70 family)